MLGRMAVLYLISYIPTKREGVTGLHEIQDNREAGGSKVRKALGLDKKIKW